MVRACFAGIRTLLFLILNMNQDACEYLKTLENHLLPFTEYLRIEWWFSHDEASFHGAVNTKTSFMMSLFWL